VDKSWHAKVWYCTHPFNGPLSGNTQVSRYQKGKTNLDFTEARDSDWQWHQLGHMQVCTSLQTDNHASTSLLSFFTGRMPFLPPNQQRQSTKGKSPKGTQSPDPKWHLGWVSCLCGAHSYDQRTLYMSNEVHILYFAE